jgi:hypothetical protein
LAYQYKPEEQHIDYPARVQAIKEIYEQYGLEWKPTPDTDLESVKETKYEELAKKRPETAYYEVIKVVRLRDEMNNEEYMTWKLKKYVEGMDGVEIDYGMLPSPLDVIPVLDQDGAIIDKKVRRRGMKYTQKWDQKFFEKLIKDSRNPRTLEFYLANTSDVYETHWYGNQLKISNYDLFKTKSYQELVDMDQQAAARNRYGGPPPPSTSTIKS